MRRRVTPSPAVFLVLLTALALSGCRKDAPPVARPQPPADAGTNAAANKPPAPPTPVAEPVPVPPEPIAGDDVRSMPLDEINRNSPLKPVFFDYDSAEINGPGQAALQENAAVLKRNSTWAITIEGHTDERGTAEYNLALGERRAVAARTYLVSLGISADRLRTVSYGKEFPFDPGKDEAAYEKNRRAHFVVTAQ